MIKVVCWNMKWKGDSWLNGVDKWGPSDHCRLLIEVGK